jgi:predicted alpha/beta hydrolase family esterase
MKRAVILHGTDGNPDINWLPWAKAELEKRGYEVFVPLLPQNHTPNREVYGEFIGASSWDFTNNLLIGHSSGATTVLNLLSSDWFPKVKATILVGTFLNEDLLNSAEWYQPGQFDNLFPKDNFDPELLRRKAEKFFFIHGNDDPYCSLDDAKNLCEAVGGEITIVQQGLHLSSNRKELPELIPILEKL